MEATKFKQKMQKKTNHLKVSKENKGVHLTVSRGVSYKQFLIVSRRNSMKWLGATQKSFLFYDHYPDLGLIFKKMP